MTIRMRENDLYKYLDRSLELKSKIPREGSKLKSLGYFTLAFRSGGSDEEGGGGTCGRWSGYQARGRRRRCGDPCYRTVRENNFFFLSPVVPAKHAVFIALLFPVPISFGGDNLIEGMLPGDQKRRGGEGDDVDRGGGGSRGIPWRAEEREEGPKAWAIVVFALIGATATTYAVGQLRRSVDFFWSQLSKSQPFSSWKNATSGSSYGGFREEAWKRYNRRLQEEYEEEMERVERIRRMQSVFNRERNKYKRSYESWRENDTSGYHQHFQRDDWYWKTDTSYKDQRDQRAKSGANHSYRGNYTMSHHYSVLGLDRTRAKPYTDAEIKTAFRAKAMEYHPDQNQNNKEAAEAKFKEVLTSYEAIKLERKNAGF